MKTCPACQQTFTDDIKSCPRDSSSLVPEIRDEQECPYCAELILKKARVCKHCGREVEPLVKADAPAQAPIAALPRTIAKAPISQPQVSGAVPTASRPPVIFKTPWLRAKPEPPKSKMRYIVAAGAALILVVAGVWYFAKLKSKRQIQQKQQTERAEPAARPSPFPITSTEATLVAVPFVGCEESGMVEGSPAPKGTEKVVKIRKGAAERLSYYKSAASPGVLAPRGWNCHGSFGSSGSGLTVTPQAQKSFEAPTTGPIVEVRRTNGGTSGRFTVAQVVARVFPAHEAFAMKVIKEGLMPASDFPFGPYPTDKLAARTVDMVEYETPPRSKGLGTGSGLIPDDNPIQGVAILQNAEWPDLWDLSVRLAPDMKELAAEIIHQFEQENLPTTQRPALASRPATPQELNASRLHLTDEMTRTYSNRLVQNGADPNRTFFPATPQTLDSVVGLVIKTNAIGFPANAQQFLESSGWWVSQAHALGFQGVRLTDGQTTCDFKIVDETSIQPGICFAQWWGGEYMRQEVVRQWPKGYTFQAR